MKFSVRDLNVWFDSVHALADVTMDIRANEILGIIGPANSGKSTFLRTLNRLNEQKPRFRMKGEVRLSGANVNEMDVDLLRKKVGMVFALPLVLPLSVFANIAYGPKMHGVRSKKRQKEIVERALKEAYLWEEVKDRLDTPAAKLSGGQQQRLCMARTLAVEPEVILFDEPCSGLDPISTAKIEDTMLRLKTHYTQILVTNNVHQASRVADRTAFFLGGRLIELDDTEKIFTAPSDKRTEDYIGGRFG